MSGSPVQMSCKEQAGLRELTRQQRAAPTRLPNTVVDRSWPSRTGIDEPRTRSLKDAAASGENGKMIAVVCEHDERIACDAAHSEIRSQVGKTAHWFWACVVGKDTMMAEKRREIKSVVLYYACGTLLGVLSTRRFIAGVQCWGLCYSSTDDFYAGGHFARKCCPPSCRRGGAMDRTSYPCACAGADAMPSMLLRDDLSW